MFEDQRVGLRHADDMAVDDDTYGHAVTVARLAHTASRQHLGDLTAGIRHHANRQTSCRHRLQRRDTLGDRPPPQVRGSRAVQQVGGEVDVAIRNTDAAHVRMVVLLPKCLTAAGGRFCRHARIVGAAVRADRRIAPVVGQQRPEHGRVRQNQHSAGIE